MKNSAEFAVLLLMRVICFFEDGVNCFCLISFCVAGDQREKCSAVSPRFGIFQQNPWIYLPACSAWQGVSKDDILTVVQVSQWQWQWCWLSAEVCRYKCLWGGCQLPARCNFLLPTVQQLNQSVVALYAHSMTKAHIWSENHMVVTHCIVHVDTVNATCFRKSFKAI